MVVDTSALMALVFDESDADRFELALSTSEPVYASTATLVEAAVVAAGRGQAYAVKLDRLLIELEIEIVPFSLEMAVQATGAIRRFGKGHHRARLNLGDLFSYALAKHLDEPLLFKGDDFAQTDVTAAL